MDYVRTRPGAEVLLTSVVPGEGGPGPFYEKLGFHYTGETEDDELVMSCSL
jgi:diamine N-acetyltransferase